MKTRTAIAVITASISFVAWFEEPAHAGNALDTVALMAVSKANCGIHFTDEEYAEWLTKAALQEGANVSVTLQLAKAQVTVFTTKLMQTGTMDRFCDRVINTLANR